MRRPSSSHRYDILTSAEAWSLIGTLDADEFASVQSEVEKLAWSAFSMRGASSNAITRASVSMRTLAMACEIDHVARRVTVVSLARHQGEKNRIVIDGEERPLSAEPEEKTSGGAGKKR